MTSPSIPFVDLASQHEEVADAVQAAFATIFSATSFINGPPVREFEAGYAAYQGVAHCVGVSNGTDALELALRASGVEAGDEVMLPANTFVATAEAVVRMGAVPVLVDCDPEYQLIDTAQVADRLTARTRCVVPVHLYGQMAPMASLGEALAARDDILIVEDAAQAQGARQNRLNAGGVGIAAGTSFYPGKNLGAYGDAGAVLTNDDDVAERVRLMRDHGSATKYNHEVLGFNCRLDSLQAAVLVAKLEHLERWNTARREVARRYDELLAGVDDVALPQTLDGNQHVWHLYVVRVPRRDEVLAALEGAGIGAGIHYKVPLHLQPAFAYLGEGPGSFPVAEAAAAEILSLPMGPHVTPDQQARVVETLVAALADTSG